MATFWAGSVTTTNGSAFVTVQSGDDINLVQERSLLQVETQQIVEVKRAFTDSGNVPTIELSEPWGGATGSGRQAVSAPTAGNLAEASERLRTLGDAASLILDDALTRSGNLQGLENPGEARDNLGLGDAAVKTVMSSLTDTTAGRLMPVGAFGLGNDSNVNVPDANLDTLQVSGVYRVISTVVGNPDEGLYQVQHWQQGAGVAVQLALMGSTSTPKALLRSRGTNGVWSGWDLLYGQSNILGTVSQSGGVPTGAIIERGSNSNGEYVKFADGTMECWNTVEAGSILSFGAGTFSNPYRTSTQIWDYPASYAAPPTVVGWGGVTDTNTSNRRYLMSADLPTASRLSSIQLLRVGESDTDSSVTIHLHAKGRWY